MMRFVPLLLAIADGHVHRDSNMDSEAHIRAYCAAGPSSLWQRYVCSRIGDADGWDRCWPQHRYSRCDHAVGVVAMFHGYSACPDAYNEMASVLQDDCFHVYSFTTPGHGHPLVANNTPGRSIIGTYNLSGLPESRLDYLTFADSAISIMREELSLTSWNNGGPKVVAAMGLSLGAPLATAVAVRSNVFSHLLNFSPFFGASASIADDSGAKINKCLASLGLSSSCVCEGIKDAWGLDKLNTSAAALCDSVVHYAHTTFPEAMGLPWDFDSLQLVLRSALEWVVESADELPPNVQELLDKPIGWGAGCETAVARYGRGGFCQFTVRHLLAAHSLGQYVVRASSNAPRAMQVFMAPTQHDGPTRNGIAFEVLHALKSTGSSVSACMWQAARGCDIATEDGNMCVVPHSSASTSDNLGLAPHFLYWNHTQRQGLASFLTGGKVTAPPEWNARKWDGSRNMCVALDAASPPSSLITDLSRLEVTVIPTAGVIKRQIEDHVLQGVANLSRVDPKLLKLLHSVLSPQGTLSGLNVQRAKKTTVLLTLLEQGKKTFEAVLAHLPEKSLEEALSFPVVDIRINGNSVVRPKTADVHEDRRAQIEEIQSTAGVLWTAGATAKNASEASGCTGELYDGQCCYHRDCQLRWVQTEPCSECVSGISHFTFHCGSLIGGRRCGKVNSFVAENLAATTTVYTLEGVAKSGDCVELDLPSADVKPAQMTDKNLTVGHCKDAGFSRADGTATKKVPVLGNITIRKFKKAADVHEGNWTQIEEIQSTECSRWTQNCPPSVLCTAKGHPSTDLANGECIRMPRFIKNQITKDCCSGTWHMTLNCFWLGGMPRCGCNPKNGCGQGCGCGYSGHDCGCSSSFVV